MNLYQTLDAALRSEMRVEISKLHKKLKHKYDLRNS